MVGSVTDSQSSNFLARVSTQQTTSSGSTDSFTQQLAAALEGYLGQSSDNSNLEIDIQSTQSQDSGVRQFLVTVTNPDSSSAPAATTAVVSVAPSDAATAADASTAPAATAPTNELDAYWAAQPAAVQQLRNVSTLAGRSELAQSLTDEGYTVDTQIMVWGWDPMKTMSMRQQYGYSWAPAWGQTETPTQNDSSSPPPGAIAVNTDFAKGLGITDPWALSA